MLARRQFRSLLADVLQTKQVLVENRLAYRAKPYSAKVQPFPLQPILTVASPVRYCP